jgi:hypothetical protein
MPPARKREPAVPARVKTAIGYILEQRADLQAAAAFAGISTYELRRSLGRPNVLRYAREQKKAALEALCLQSPAHLADVLAQMKWRELMPSNPPRRCGLTLSSSSSAAHNARLIFRLSSSNGARAARRLPADADDAAARRHAARGRAGNSARCRHGMSPPASPRGHSAIAFRPAAVIAAQTTPPSRVMLGSNLASPSSTRSLSWS